MSLALRMVKIPTGPQPNTATVSPASISARSAPKYAVGKMIREQNGLLVSDAIGKLDEPDVRVGNTNLFGLHPVKTARGFRPAEKGGPGAFTVRVGVVALRVISGAAVRTRPARDGRGDHHTVADAQVTHVVTERFDHCRLPSCPKRYRVSCR